MGVCTVTQMVGRNGVNIPARNDDTNGDRYVILQITPSATYATTGDTIDLTPYFASFVYGGELLSSIDVPTCGTKFEINVNPAAAVTATSTRLMAYLTLDPGSAGGDNVPFEEITVGTSLAAFETVWKFRGR